MVTINIEVERLKEELNEMEVEAATPSEWSYYHAQKDKVNI